MLLDVEEAEAVLTGKDNVQASYLQAHMHSQIGFPGLLRMYLDHSVHFGG